tara:strand:- start:144 stop:257 length:114 start_codon:yes stop_codon:yes gene_type:complete
MFKYSELEQLFSDPLDQIIDLVNKSLYKIKFVKIIFS